MHSDFSFKMEIKGVDAYAMVGACMVLYITCTVAI